LLILEFKGQDFRYTGMIRATNIFRGKIDANNLVFVDPDGVPYERDPILRENDIIVVRSGAYTADSAIVPKEFDGAVAGYDMVIRCYTDNPRFISYCLLSHFILKNQLLLHSMRAAQPHLNREELGETFVVMPPMDEQISILDHIETECSRLDTIINNREIQKTDKATQRIPNHPDFRSGTGKIDVRDEVAAWQADIPAENGHV
jgi:type I restriction enzyme, S subunit